MSTFEDVCHDDWPVAIIFFHFLWLGMPLFGSLAVLAGILDLACCCGCQRPEHMHVVIHNSKYNSSSKHQEPAYQNKIKVMIKIRTLNILL